MMRPTQKQWGTDHRTNPRGVLVRDITSVLMGDPAARFTREPTTRERDRRPLREWTSVWSELEVGDRSPGLSQGTAMDGRTWLRKHGRDGISYRTIDGTYTLTRTV